MPEKSPALSSDLLLILFHFCSSIEVLLIILLFPFPRPHSANSVLCVHIRFCEFFICNFLHNFI